MTTIGAALGRALRASLAASLVIGIVDWATSARRAHVGATELALVVASVTCAGVAWALLGAAASVVTVRRRKARGSVATLGGLACGVLLATPHVPLLVHVVAARLPSAWLVVTVIVAQTCGVTLLVRRVARRAPVLPAACAVAVVCAALAYDVVLSLGAFAKAGPSPIDRAAVSTVGVVLVLGVVAWAVLTRLVAAYAGIRTSLPVAVLALLGGTAASIVACTAMPGLYATPRQAGLVVAFACLSLAATRLAAFVPSPVVAVALLAGIGGAVEATAGAQVSTALWTTMHATTVARTLARQSGVLERRTRSLHAALRTERAEAFARGRALAEPPPPPPASLPRVRSVLLVTVDALRFDHVGYSGLAPAGLTPTADRLASDAVRFTQAYASAPFTGPSASSLLWGKDPLAMVLEPIAGSHSRVYPAGAFPPSEVLWFTSEDPRAEPSRSIAEELRDHGFRTAAISTGFMGFFRSWSGAVRGFSDVVVPEETTPGHEDDWTARAASAWISAHAGDRFFVWTHLFGPHLEYVSHAESAPFGGYAGEVRFVDRQLGALLDALERAGRAGDTLVVLTADHGELLAPRGHGHPPELLAELLHVPLLVRWPGVSASTVNAPVSLVDVGGTLARAVGVELAPPRGDLTVHLAGEHVPEKPVFSSAWSRDRDGGRQRKVGMRFDGLSVTLDVPTGTFACHDMLTDALERDDLFGARDACFTAAATLLGWFEAMPLGG